ncbi:MAG: hypothetical protein GY839_14040 [candidate division Zixibacteria bacterium]|nr:hypothetical protein [candidate division Zixibacteria bacterium]
MENNGRLSFMVYFVYSLLADCHTGNIFISGCLAIIAAVSPGWYSSRRRAGIAQVNHLLTLKIVKLTQANLNEMLSYGFQNIALEHQTYISMNVDGSNPRIILEETALLTYYSPAWRPITLY